MPRMTRLIPLALAAALAAAPALAQEAAEEPSLFQRGTELMFRGLLEEMAPPLEELAQLTGQAAPVIEALVDEFGPAIAEVASQIDSITYYEAPAIQPNGDVLMRRRADAPAYVPPAPAEEPAPEAAPEGESWLDRLTPGDGTEL